MNEWKDNHGDMDGSIHRYVGLVEIRYFDRHNVTRTAQGMSFPPFGVSVDGVNGAEFPEAQHAHGYLSEAVPYGRIKQWRETA